MSNIQATDDTQHPSPIVRTIARHLQPLMTSKNAKERTPAIIIERAIQTMGAIDLDPCSDKPTGDGPNVPAAAHYTEADDGLSLPWHGRVYMNPPYGRQIGAWVGKLVSEYNAGNVEQAVALLPARTDTRWMALLREYPRCYIRGRLKFGDHTSSAPFPSAVVFLGLGHHSFVKAFGDIGDIYWLIS